MLKVNKGIKKLELGENSIGSVGMAIISEALQVNRYLTDIDLSSIGIDEVGIKILAHGLQFNQSLSKVTLLNSYGMEKMGIVYLANTLNANTTLTTLEFFDHQGKLSDGLFRNNDYRAQRRNRIFKKLIFLAFWTRPAMNGGSAWSNFPTELRTRIISFISFSSQESIGKTPHQIVECFKFIDRNIQTIIDHLQEKKIFQIWDHSVKISVGNTRCFFHLNHQKI
jgi:hypothetical protein